jgi:hypothetical protein
MEIQSGAVSPTGAIEEGWNIIKDDYWTFFGICLVFGVIVIGVGLLVGTVNGVIDVAVRAAFGALDPSKNKGLSAATIVPGIASLIVSSITNIVIMLVMAMMMCGVYSSLSRKVTQGYFEFGDVFSGFTKFQPCLIVSLVLSIIQFIIGIFGLLIVLGAGVSFKPDMLLKDGKFDPTLVGGLFGIIAVVVILSILVQLIIGIGTMFVYPLIAERNLPGIDAISNSIRGGFSNVLGLIGLIILQSLMLLVAAILCVVPILFVIPIFYASTFAAYRSVFGGISGSNTYNQPPPPPIFSSQQGY